LVAAVYDPLSGKVATAEADIGARALIGSD
jgi:hypothetical protein